MRVGQQAKRKQLPTQNNDAILDGIKNDVLDAVSKEKKYAVASATNKKFSLITNVLAKNAARVKKLEQSDQKQKEEEKKSSKVVTDTTNTISALTSSMNTIAASLGRMNVMLAKVAKGPVGKPEAIPEARAVPVAQPSAAATGDGDGSLFKTLLQNPVVQTALAGIIYMFLPKEQQDKIKAFLHGFGVGVQEGMADNEASGLGKFNTALKVAGTLLAVHFGVKMIAAVSELITTVISATRKLGGGKLGRGVAIAAGAGIGAYALYKRKTKDSEDTPDANDIKATATEKPDMAPAGATKPGGAIPSPSTSQQAGAPSYSTTVGVSKQEQGLSSIPATQQDNAVVVRKGEASSSGFQNPTKGRVSSPFGVRTHPISGQQSMHPGVDIANAAGTPILATKSGTVQIANYGWNGGFGNFIQVDHGNGEISRYAHLSEINVGPGAKVEQGQEIGKMGTSGQSTGNHLHFEVRKNGQPVDPASMMAGLGSPLPATSMLAQTATDAPRPTAQGPGGTAPPSYTLASAPGSGKTIDDSSHAVQDQAATSVSKPIVKNINTGSAKKHGKETGQQEMPIPSPIASRGSLNLGSKHVTRYATA